MDFKKPFRIFGFTKKTTVLTNTLGLTLKVPFDILDNFILFHTEKCAFKPRKR